MSEKIIGVFPMFNTGGICVHAIDDAEDMTKSERAVLRMDILQRVEQEIKSCAPF